MTTARGVSGKPSSSATAARIRLRSTASHALHTPVLGVTFNQAIDFTGAVGSDPEQIFGKALDIGAHVSTLAPKGLAHLLRSLLSHIALEKHLQGKFAGFAAGSQSGHDVSRRSQSSTLSLQEAGICEWP